MDDADELRCRRRVSRVETALCRTDGEEGERT
jgi:hypothetical protein